MKKKLLLIILVFLFIPNVVFAHNANTKVSVDVFYKEESDELNTLKEALKELGEDESIKGKYEVKYTKYSDSPKLSERVYLYAYAEDENLVYFVGNSYYKGFSSSKYYYDSYESSLYKYEKTSIKNMINYNYPNSYEDILPLLESGYYDSILYSEDDSEPITKSNYNDSYYMDEDFEELFKWLKDDLKIDKEYKKYIYTFLITFTILYGLKVLKRSIHKNR